MGAWGVGIMSNDLAAGLKGDYQLLVAVGIEGEEADLRMIEGYRTLAEDPEDGADFWYALALTQWRMGRLTEKVKNKALELMESGEELERWKGSERKKRIKAVENLKETLHKPMGKVRRGKMPIHIADPCPWKIGDLFRIPLKNGEYGAVQVLNIYRRPMSYLARIDQCYDEYVILGIYAWRGKELPSMEALWKAWFILLNPGHGRFSDPEHTLMICALKKEYESFAGEWMGNMALPLTLPTDLEGGCHGELEDLSNKVYARTLMVIPLSNDAQ